MSWDPEFIPTIPGAAWPGFVGGEGAARLAALFQLERTQWLPPEALLKQQLDQACQVLGHAERTIPFYRERLRDAEIDPREPLSSERWRAIPILTRAELQSAGQKLLSQSVPKHHGKVKWGKTSGSTGEPVKVATTAVVGHFWKVFTLRDHLWHRRDFTGKLAAIRAIEGSSSDSAGRSSPSWGSATRDVFRTGPSVSLHIGAGIDAQARWLKRQNPAYLLTYPSNLAALIRHCVEQEIRLPRLREVRTLGEIVTPQVRETCREEWGLPLVDMYTSQEFGYLALQCPDCDHLHVQAENVLLEILDDAGRPCAPGETGRVVITGLQNFAMPLIRYEIGDHATAGGPCECGRGLPVITSVLGRTRNMLVTESGEQRWPLLGYRRFRDIAPIRQLQAIQKSHTALHVRLVVESPLSPSQEEQIKTVICNSLAHPFEITLEYLEQIPPGKSGKFEEFRNELTP